MPVARPFLVLHDADDLACVDAACPEALAGDVLAFDADIHLLLHQRGVEHLTPWDLVARDELPRLRAYQASVWQHWTTHARLDFEGINLLGMAAARHASALARLVWAAYVLRRAVERLRPSAVYTFDEPPSHGLDQPPDYRKMPLLFGLLRGLAERADLPVRLLSREALPGAGGFEDQIAKLDGRCHEPVDAEALIGGRPFVLFHANRADVVRQLPLIRAVRRETDFEAVQLYKVAEGQALREAATCGHLLWHESQVTDDVPSPDVATAARRARADFDAAGRAAAEELRVVFDNPHVASHFDFLFGEYAGKMASHVRTWKALFAKCRPAAFVANYPAPIYDVAAAMGIPCLGLGHGLMMVGRPYRFTTLPESSLIGALSELHRDRLVAAGVSRERIRVTGDPWCDRLLKAARDRKDAAESSASVRDRLGIGLDRRVVLLCTGSFGMPSKMNDLPATDWADGVRCMRDLAAVVRRRGEWAFVVKCHPRLDYPALYAEVNQSLPDDRQLIVVTGGALEPLVGAADVVCVWGTVTSALVEASLLSRPVMMFARNVIWYDPEQYGTDAWLHLHDIEAFEAELDRLFSDANHYADRVRQTDLAVRRYLGDATETAPMRCVRVLWEFMPSAAHPPFAHT